jgi:predicted dehydrogenase
MVGVAVIGLGRIGRLHAENLARHVPGARLVMVVDAVPELAERVAGDVGADWSASPDGALGRPDVDAVVIAAPTPLHAELIERAAAAGRHVFCEKPLGTRVEDVERAVGAAREAGLLLQPGFQRRFDPDFVAAKDRLESGVAGRIQLIRIAHRNRTPPHDGDLTDRLGSIFLDLTVHDFDTVLWLVGDVVEVNSFEHTRNAISVLTLADGAMGLVDNSRYAGYGFECSAELVGSERTLRIGARGHRRDVDELSTLGTLSHIAEDNIERHGSAYRDELRHFIHCVERGEEPCVTGEDAIAALRLALMAQASAGVAHAECAS